MDKFFKISERGSTVKAEVMGGLTTFFAMAYIVFVNPNQVAGEGANGWLAATALAETGRDVSAQLGQIWNSVFVASLLAAIPAIHCRVLKRKWGLTRSCSILYSIFFCKSWNT